MKRTILLLLPGVIGSLAAFAQDPKPPTQPKPQQKHQIVSAAQANGVYRYYQSEFRILAQGHNKLKLQFDGIYMTLAKSPNMVMPWAKPASTATSRRSSHLTSHSAPSIWCFFRAN